MFIELNAFEERRIAPSTKALTPAEKRSVLQLA